MRLAINVDGYRFDIDSIDPELLGRWVVEIFARIGEPHPATYITVQIYPSWARGPAGQGRSDWVADSRVIGNTYPIRAPRDLLAVLAEQIKVAEGLNP